MKKMWVYLKDYKKECVLGPLFKLLEATLELFVPVVMAAVIDSGVKRGDEPYIWRMCGVLVALGVVGLAFSITAQYFAAKAAVGFSGQLRSALFRHVQALSYTEMDTAGTSTIITRMTSDINQVQSGLNMALRLFLRSPFVVVGAMLMAFAIDAKSAMVFAAAIALLSLVIFGLMAWTMPLYKKVQAGLDKVLGITRENLTGVRVIRAFNRQRAETDRFDGGNQGLTRLQLAVGRISALMNPVTYVIVNLATVALIWQGALQVDGGAITQGQLVALVSYMAQILVELIKLANTIVLTSKALACAGRVQTVLDMPNTLAAPARPRFAHPSPGVPAVQFAGASITYKNGGEEALSDVNLTVPHGQTVGVIGGTGSGKSTLVNLIPRFYDVTRGQVLVDGLDVREYDPQALRQKIGVVPQKAVLFAGTIRENLQWGRPDATDGELWAALELAQAAEVVRGKPGGLDEPVEQGGRNLSGGQRQRLTIARALVRRPEILILDDSASALDFATDAALRKALRAMPGAPTVFIVSQRAASIRHADQIVVLDDGEVADIGTHDELLARCAAYSEIYYSQFEKPEEKGAVQ